MRHHQIVPWILGVLFLAACGKTTDKTELMVTVWTDFSVPEELDEIRILVTGEKGGKVDRSFVLTSTGEQDKVSIPVRLGLAPGGAKSATIAVAVTGLSKKEEIVWQTATLPFIPDTARELVVYLANACKGVRCVKESGRTCEPTTGKCDRPIAVGQTELKPYSPGQSPTKPSVLGGAGQADAAVADVGGDGPAGETVTEVMRTDATLDAAPPDGGTDVPTGTGGTGGMQGSGGVGGGGGSEGTGWIGGTTNGGETGTGGLGGSIATGGNGGMTSTVRTSAGGAVDAGLDGPVDAPASGGVVDAASDGHSSLGGATGGTTASGGTTTLGGASGGSSTLGGASGGSSTSGGAGSSASVSASGGTVTGGATGGAGEGGAGGTVNTGGTSSTGGSGCVKGQTVGNQVLAIGDEFFGLSSIIEEVMTRAKAAGSLAAEDRYVSVAQSGSPIATIANRYKGASTRGTAKYVIMTGGRLDCMYGDFDSNPSGADGILATIAQLLDTMASDNVESVVYVFNPDPQGSTHAQTKKNLDVVRPRVEALCNQRTAPKCYFLDLLPVWGGHYSEYTQDGLLPTDAGSVATGSVIWQTMVDNCIAQ